MQHIHTGKVRELYRLDDGRLLMVATDRISAFDYVLDSEIPDKGRILTAMSVWWFGQLAEIVPSHLLSATDPAIPATWRGRAILCTELDMLPVEAVARGYLAGSGLIDYGDSGAICGNPLPAGLRDGDQLPAPIFTPATKAALGEHDENVSYDTVAQTVGEPTAAELKGLTLGIYQRAASIARERGIILADTKFEFGRRPGSAELVLGDEVLTPDSSRFWPADRWEPGHAQPSFDKQYVRDWLLSAESGWDRASGAKPPALPDEVLAQTRQRYVEAYERLTGLRFADWTG
ncbi:MAG TPA: phosphoribosylaminoimidazolesuccinocarboxamide synthase [Jatrophihabitantaceae bacterium]|nr:phosphoribosylaminoimidazolesuccinocarboxamide synthase [Jatrophihabitantaceae bacterium]